LFFLLFICFCLFSCLLNLHLTRQHNGMQNLISNSDLWDNGSIRFWNVNKYRISLLFKRLRFWGKIVDVFLFNSFTSREFSCSIYIKVDRKIRSRFLNEWPFLNINKVWRMLNRVLRLFFFLVLLIQSWDAFKVDFDVELVVSELEHLPNIVIFINRNSHILNLIVQKRVWVLRLGIYSLTLTDGQNRLLVICTVNIINIWRFWSSW